MTQYYIGLDNGGTTTKAALINDRGEEVGVYSVSTQSLTPTPGFVERNMEEMWEANCEVIRGVLKKTGIDPALINGVGVSGHGKGLYLWGNNNVPVRNGIISTDNRAYAYPIKWAENGVESRAFKISCQHIMACQPVSLLAWLKENEPENYRSIKYIFECKDYIRFCLTGVAAAELTDYSGANLLNLHTGDYDDELLELFDIQEMKSALPPLVHATDIAGYITEDVAVKTGLRAGTPVSGGMFDINACAIGSGVIRNDMVCMIAGTWSINEYIRRSPVLNGNVQMNSLFALPGYYLVEESSPTSAGNLEWYIKQLLPEAKKEASAMGGNIYEIVDEWIEEIKPEEFVPVFLPFLMASNVHPNAKGAFIGLNVSHSRKHLARSIFEGITFCHRFHYEKLLRTRESEPSVIRLSGGAAHADVWAQMFADVLQCPVETVSVNEVGSLGCAITTAVAINAFATIEEAVERMTGVEKRYEPDYSKKEIYDRKYLLYKKIIESLDGIWGEMQKLIEL